MNYRFALAGNPNVGKTTVFNKLTRSFEHVGNWHGVTVDAARKTVRHGGDSITLSDLPGLYSLSANSYDESISTGEINGGGNDVIINVCDANSLSRNLYLTMQLIEAGANVAILVNMTDELEKRGGRLDTDGLANALGVPVITFRKGNEDLILDEAVKCAKGARRTKSAAPRTAAARYKHIDSLLRGIYRAPADKTGKGADKLLLNKYLAVPIFLLIMLTILAVTFGEFTAGGRTYGFIGYLLKVLLGAFIENCVKVPVTGALTAAGATDWVVGLVSEGIIGGIGGVLIFLPQIVLLFLFLACLEDSGYISRIAFMTDGLFQKIGLSGKSVFTMLMGFGCSATAVLTARGLDDRLMRKKTVLLTPFVSCSARLPVYLAVCSAYFAAGQIFVITGMYVLGVAVSIACAALLQKTKRFRSGEAALIMEMPPYRFPTAARLVQLLWHNIKSFLLRIGTVIFVLNIAVWLLSHFSFSFAYVGGSVDESILGIIAGGLSVLFVPLGFGNANAVTALLSGLIAKEAVISALDTLGGVSAAFGGDYASAAALAFLVFTLLYVPCIATVSATLKESGAKWTVVGIAIQTAIAYVLSFAVYRLGVLFISHTGAMISISVVIATGTAAIIIINYLVYKKKKGCLGCRSNYCMGDSCKKTEDNEIFI